MTVAGTMTRAVARIGQPRILLAAMIVFQVLWLAATWLFEAAGRPGKISPLVVYSIVVGLGVILWPARFSPKLGQWREKLVRHERLVLVAMSVTVFAAGGLYATQQRVWRDEQSALEVASVVAEGGAVNLLRQYGQYSWLAHQHPPLMPIVNGTVMRLFGSDLLVTRLVALVFASALIPVVYLLGRELYDRESGLAAALLFLSFPLVMRLGSAGMTDVPVTFFFSLALLLILRLLRAPSYKLALLAGVVLVTGILVKYTMALIYPVLFCWFIASPPLRQRKRYLAAALAVTAVIAAGWLVVAYAIGVLGTQVRMLSGFLIWVFLGDGVDFLLETLTTRLPAALGVYNFPIMVVGAWSLLRRRSQADVLVMLWIAVVFLPLMLTVPDHRYFMLAFPAVALLMAGGLAGMPEVRPRAVLLSLLYGAGALYLLVDWARAALLFIK